METIGPKPFVDPLVEVLDFRAEANGSDYEVRVGLPPSYRQGSGHYPLLLMLDADAAFGMTHAGHAVVGSGSEPSGPVSSVHASFVALPSGTLAQTGICHVRAGSPAEPKGKKRDCFSERRLPFGEHVNDACTRGTPA